jgi:hypothetical protein
MMAHVLEPATTGRSQCRACGAQIARDELRFGERRENAFGEGESTVWFHPLCAAYARPEQVLELLNTQSIAHAEPLRSVAEAGVAHPKLARLKGAERSPTGRASCRHCHRPIAKDSWRLALMFFEEFRFNAGGFVHAACAAEYFGTPSLRDRVLHFSPQLSAADLGEIERAVTARSASP